MVGFICVTTSLPKEVCMWLVYVPDRTEVSNFFSFFLSRKLLWLVTVSVETVLWLVRREVWGGY